MLVWLHFEQFVATASQPNLLSGCKEIRHAFIRAAAAKGFPFSAGRTAVTLNKSQMFKHVFKRCSSANMLA
jgi:hypothetical protein